MTRDRPDPDHGCGGIVCTDRRCVICQLEEPSARKGDPRVIRLDGQTYLADGCQRAHARSGKS